MKKLVLVFLATCFIIQFVKAQNELEFTVVYNNLPSKVNLETDWGYSVWIKTKNEIILFDSGTKEEILRWNLEKLKFDPSEINVVVISHEHGDHTGGINLILGKLKNGTKVYIPNNFSATLKNDFPKINIIQNNTYKEIAKDIWLTEIFIDEVHNIKEQALVIIDDEKLYVITGCAHPGIAEMCERIINKFPDKKPELVTGGFHLGGISQVDVEQISDKLKSLGFQKVGPSHCTGEKSIEVFKERWGENYVHLDLGDSFNTR